jgi:hypothetical protein
MSSTLGRDLGGEPIHTRWLGVVVTGTDAGRVEAHGSLLDLRTRGFLPVGGSMQGMGVIHHMELTWRVDPASGIVETYEPGQPTVAFEATTETEGECCRDPMDAVRTLGGVALGAGFSSAVRERIGGALGCSHLVTLSFFMDAALRAGLAWQRAHVPARAASPVPGAPLFRRDVVFDGHERADGQVVVGMRWGDLHWNDAPATALAPARFAGHHELRATIEVDLWPGELRAITGAERVRTAADFADAPWHERTARLATLVGLGLARGAAGELKRRLGDGADVRPWQDALLHFAPALVQCRAAHPDAWHEKVRRTDRHPGLTAIPDSCWMWRRGGALERIRAQHGATKGGR